MRRFFVFFLCLQVVSGLGCSGNEERADAPVCLSMWHVYGSQTSSPFNDTIAEFNRTTGREKGIVVDVTAVADTSDVDRMLVAAAHEEPGAATLPTLFVAYPRVAERIGMDRLLDWRGHLSEKLVKAYVPEFLAEGFFGRRLLMLPVAKSTELLFLNRTFFDRFAAETGINSETLATFEGLFAACNAYHDWSGGRAMFQINDFYHYFLSGMASLGGELVRNGTLDTQNAVFEAVCLPLIRAALYGGLSLEDGYASDRWKTGEVIGNIGSSAGILYLRDHVTFADNSREHIETALFPYPVFSGAVPVAVQRGAGLFAVRSDDPQINEASAVFAAWLAEARPNIGFVTRAGYLPVTRNAFVQLLADPKAVENPKYRKLYAAVKDMYGRYTFRALPVYAGSGEIQAAFEKTVRTGLAEARAAYLRRIAAGENAARVMEELVPSVLVQLRANLQ